MTDTDSAAPAAKLQKVTVGDVTVASSVQMQEVLSEPVSAVSSAAQVADVDGAPPSAAASAASQIDGGKKRKVALYVAYIGAGYHVSVPVCDANNQFSIDNVVQSCTRNEQKRKDVLLLTQQLYA